MNMQIVANKPWVWDKAQRKKAKVRTRKKVEMRLKAKKRKKKEVLKRREMITQLQSGISTIPPPNNPTFAPIHQTRLMIEEAGEGKSNNTRRSTYKIYEPP